MSFIIGLTGQSGAGKTTVCKQFSSEGFGIINCDEVARECMTDASSCVRELSKAFPSCVDEKLSLDRKGISQLIFSNSDMLKRFDDIVYPHINELIDKALCEMSGKYEYIVLDAPTLFEAGADKKCDVIIGVVANEDIRLERIVKRDNISRELALKRFKSQQSTEFIKKHCDYIIENSGSMEQARQDTLEIIKLIKEISNG